MLWSCENVAVWGVVLLFKPRVDTRIMRGFAYHVTANSVLSLELLFKFVWSKEPKL